MWCSLVLYKLVVIRIDHILNIIIRNKVFRRILMRDKISLESIVSITHIFNSEILLKLFYILIDSYLDVSI